MYSITARFFLIGRQNLIVEAKPCTKHFVIRRMSHGDRGSIFVYGLYTNYVETHYNPWYHESLHGCRSFSACYVFSLTQERFLEVTWEPCSRWSPSSLPFALLSLWQASRRYRFTFWRVRSRYVGISRREKVCQVLMRWWQELTDGHSQNNASEIVSGVDTWLRAE